MSFLSSKSLVLLGDDVAGLALVDVINGFCSTGAGNLVV
jgi:hypothetical protein